MGEDRDRLIKEIELLGGGMTRDELSKMRKKKRKTLDTVITIALIAGILVFLYQKLF